jgi:hypothetical protein
MMYCIQLTLFSRRLNKVKASGGCHDFLKEIFRASSKKIGRKYAKAHLIMIRGVASDEYQGTVIRFKTISTRKTN